MHNTLESQAALGAASILSILQAVDQLRLIIMDTLSRMLCGQLFKFTEDCAL